MSNFSKSDASFEKPYLNMLAEQIESKTPIDFGTSDGKEKVKLTPEVKQFIKAVKTGRWTNVAKILYPKSQWAPIFNGKKWTQINKKPFSGKGGSGAGAELTALVECMQCYVSAYQFNIKKAKLTAKDITKTNLKKALKFVDADRDLDKCLKNGPQDWMDNGVYILIANSLYNEYKGRTSGAIYFHRGSSFMNNIYQAKTECHKNDRSSESPQAPGSFGHDKWNPGDIWMSSLGKSEKPLKNFTESWEMLNSEVARLAGEKGNTRKTKLLGISLKKTLSPKITRYRDPQSKSEKKASYDGFIFGKNGDFFSSQDVYLHSNAGEVQFRTFSGNKSWQGEIKGKLAAGGKIGGGNVNFYAHQYLVDDIFGNQGESGLFSRVNINSQSFLKEFYELYKESNEKQMVRIETMSYKKFVEQLKKQDTKFLNSKYACLKLTSALIRTSSTRNKNFMTAIFRYASSDTDQSSFYIKIH